MLKLRAVEDISDADFRAAVRGAVSEAKKEAKTQFEAATASALRDLRDTIPLKAAAAGLLESPFGQELLLGLPIALRSVRTEVTEKDGVFELTIAPPDEEMKNFLTNERVLMALEAGTSRSRPVGILAMLNSRLERKAEDIEKAIADRMTDALRRRLR